MVREIWWSVFVMLLGGCVSTFPVYVCSPLQVASGAVLVCQAVEEEK